MPSAQAHYPFTDGGHFESSFPADFICEAIDQTRGWFYSLLAVNTLVFGSTPYRNVVCLGHIVDGDGQKMSKSKGNVIDPWDIFGRFGADAWSRFSSASSAFRSSPPGVFPATVDFGVSARSSGTKATASAVTWPFVPSFETIT